MLEKIKEAVSIYRQGFTPATDLLEDLGIPRDIYGTVLFCNIRYATGYYTLLCPSGTSLPPIVSFFKLKQKYPLLKDGWHYTEGEHVYIYRGRSVSLCSDFFHCPADLLAYAIFCWHLYGTYEKGN